MPGDIYSSPEDLYNLAAQAGIVTPNEDTSAPTADADLPYPTAWKGWTQDQLNSSTPTPGLTAGAQTVAASMKPQVGGEVDAVSGSDQRIPPSGTSSKVSASYRGFDPAQYNKVLAATNPELAKMLAAADAEGQKFADPQLAAEDAAYQSRIAAQGEMTKAAIAQAHAEGHAAEILKGVQSDFAAEEARINEQYRGMSNKAKADYVAALADLRASHVDPNALWHDMSGGQSFLAFTSAFAHGFLGAKGIHTDAMNILNSAIDRNISAQIQNIKTKGDVAEGFKSLWYMQRNEAASDAEARSRVRGFMLEAAKQNVISYMSQFNAGLATAQGQAALAAIDEEHKKNLIDVYQHIDQNTIALRGQAVNAWATKAQLGLGWAQFKAQQDARAQKTPPPINMAALIPDITPSGGGVARWKFNGDPKEIGTEKMNDIKDRMGALAFYDKKIGELQTLIRETGPIANVPDFLKSPAGQRMTSLRDSIATSLVIANSGKAFSQEEVKQRQAQFPIDTWLTNGERAQTVAQTANYLRDEAFSKMAQYVHEIQPNEPEFGMKISPALGAPGESTPGAPGLAAQTEQKNILAPPVETGDEKLFKDESGRLTGPQSLEKISDPPSDVKVEHEKFLKENPQVMTQERAVSKEGEIPRYEESLIRLKDIIQKDPKSPLADKAYKLILDQAKPFVKGINSEDPEAIFATMVLHEVAGIDPDRPAPELER